MPELPREFEWARSFIIHHSVLLMTPTHKKIRIDKWLYAVRIFKTRAQAADACAKNKVRIAEQTVKASRLIKAGDIIAIRIGSFTMQHEVLQLTEKRIAAKLTVEYRMDCTSEAEMIKIRLHELQLKERDNYETGRPTKKDRRELDEFLDY